MTVCAAGILRRGGFGGGAHGSGRAGSRAETPRAAITIGALLMLGGASCAPSPLTHCTDPGGCKLPLVCHQKTNLCWWPQDAGADAGEASLDAGMPSSDADGGTTDAGGTADPSTTDSGVAPSALSYGSPTAVYTKGLAITQNVPAVQGGPVESYGVSPALPSGLTLDVSTGVISGTPVTVTAQAVYTVTATNNAGSASFKLSIMIVDAAPSDLQYSANPAVYTKGMAITPNVPKSTGGALASYAVTPALPDGLSLDSATGTISGTPSGLAGQATYTVTGTADSGRTSATLTITVIDVSPSNFKYEPSTVSSRTGYPLSPKAPTSSGGAVVSYSVAPALSAGLRIDPDTGVISGTPTLALTAERTTTHVVTATNSGGSASTTLSITLAPRLGTNGTVHAMTMGADETVYLGGAFTEVGPVTGGGVPLDASTGAVLALPAVAGSVLAVVADGSGGWIVGGKFSGVGGTPTNNLAHIRGDGSVDAAWPSSNDTVQALAVSEGVVYVGGDFTSLGKVDRNRLGAISLAGEVTSWNPNAGGTVFSLAVSGGIVYAGGLFSGLGPNPHSSYALPRKNLAAISASGEVTPWAPNPDSTVLTLAVAGNVIYVGGYFSALRPSTDPGNVLYRSCLAAITPAGVVTTWDPSADAPVRALAVKDDAIYVGGSFATIAGSPRSRLAAISTSGKLADWDPSADDMVATLAIEGGMVYVGGRFTKLGSESRRQLAAVDALGWSHRWTPRVAATPRLAPESIVPAGVRALAIAGGTVYAGGYITTSDGARRSNLAAIDSSGALTAWNPNANDQVRALATSAGIVYAGGAFTSVGEVPRKYLAALYPSGAVITSWNPAPNNWVFALASQGGTVYAGGDFSLMGDVARSRLAAIEGGVLTPWDPGANARVTAIAVGGGTIYVGGAFSLLRGVVRNSLAAVDSQGVVSDSWNPNANGPVSTLAVDGSTIYAGGGFETMGGDLRKGLAAVQSSGLVTPWNPGIGYASALMVRGSTVFAGGNFSRLRGDARSGVAAIATSGLVSSWDPGFGNDKFGMSVNCIVASESSVYAGGDFLSMGAQPVAFFTRLQE